jgi:hypothetical protein
MARGHGIPCVTGFLEATPKNKTSPRVRLNRNRGIVDLLDKCNRMLDLSAIIAKEQQRRWHKEWEQKNIQCT